MRIRTAIVPWRDCITAEPRLRQTCRSRNDRRDVLRRRARDIPTRRRCRPVRRATRSHGHWRDAPIQAPAFRRMHLKRWRPTAPALRSSTQPISSDGFVFAWTARDRRGVRRMRRHAARAIPFPDRAACIVRRDERGRSAAYRHSPRGTGGGAKPLSLPGNGFALRRSASSSFSFCANSATPITPTFAASPYFEFAT